MCVSHCSDAEMCAVLVVRMLACVWGKVWLFACLRVWGKVWLSACLRVCGGRMHVRE